LVQAVVWKGQSSRCEAQNSRLYESSASMVKKLPSTCESVDGGASVCADDAVAADADTWALAGAPAPSPRLLLAS
jgi:hypothetical protein